MGRWEPDARDRLERAALDLFAAQGFAETTVPQITERAGLTTRTFFRHFADKRAVLFAIEDELPAITAEVMAQIPPSLAPMPTIERALHIVAVRFPELHGYLRTRRAIIAADEALRERELRKNHLLGEAARREFVGRGLDELTATLCAQLMVAVFTVALDRWLDQEAAEPSLDEIARETLRALTSLVSGP